MDGKVFQSNIKAGQVGKLGDGVENWVENWPLLGH